VKNVADTYIFSAVRASPYSPLLCTCSLLLETCLPIFIMDCTVLTKLSTAYLYYLVPGAASIAQTSAETGHIFRQIITFSQGIAPRSTDGASSCPMRTMYYVFTNPHLKL